MVIFLCKARIGSGVSKGTKPILATCIYPFSFFPLFCNGIPQENTYLNRKYFRTYT